MATKKVKEDILRRSRIIEGHLKKVVSMIDNDEYCLDILNQSLAVQSALKKIDEMLLEDHLSHCVIKQIKEGKADTAVREVLETFKKRR